MSDRSFSAYQNNGYSLRNPRADKKKQKASTREDNEFRNNVGETGLIRQARENVFADVKTLVAEGSNVNATDNNGWTALHEAVCNANYEMTKFLIEHGADLDIGTIHNRWTPMHTVIRQVCCSETAKEKRPALLECFKLLYDNGADMVTSDANGHSPNRLLERDHPCDEFLAMKEYSADGSPARKAFMQRKFDEENRRNEELQERMMAVREERRREADAKKAMRKEKREREKARQSKTQLIASLPKRKSFTRVDNYSEKVGMLDRRRIKKPVPVEVPPAPEQPSVEKEVTVGLAQEAPAAEMEPEPFAGEREKPTVDEREVITIPDADQDVFVISAILRTLSGTVGERRDCVAQSTTSKVVTEDDVIEGSTTSEDVDVVTVDEAPVAADTRATCEDVPQQNALSRLPTLHPFLLTSLLQQSLSTGTLNGPLANFLFGQSIVPPQIHQPTTPLSIRVSPSPSLPSTATFSPGTSSEFFSSATSSGTSTPLRDIPRPEELTRAVREFFPKSEESGALLPDILRKDPRRSGLPMNHCSRPSSISNQSKLPPKAIKPVKQKRGRKRAAVEFTAPELSAPEREAACKRYSEWDKNRNSSAINLSGAAVRVAGESEPAH